MARTQGVKLLRKHFALLKHLSKCSNKECEHLMKGMSDEVVKVMAQICVNLMNKNIPLKSPEAVRALTAYKKELRAISKPKTKVTRQRKVLEQKGGFIGTILSVALPLLASLLSGR